jgi:uncharacterized cupredoxin-like copper-binding protein
MIIKKLSKWILISTFILAVTLAASGCSAASKDKSTDVNVNMADYGFQLDKASVPAGLVNFQIKNPDAVGHEMVVIKTDLDAKQLPTNSDGTVDESQLESKGEIEVEAGANADLAVTLEAGHYVLLCNEPGHYAQGMVTNFTVQ